jgi:hypothetical protein
VKKDMGDIPGLFLKLIELDQTCRVKTPFRTKKITLRLGLIDFAFLRSWGNDPMQ